MTPKFIKNQVYKYSQEDWSVIGVVISTSKTKVTFQDLVVDGRVDSMHRWKQYLPLSFKSPKFQLLGTIEDFPEYRL